ncbi:hypothetical protein HPB52_014224 [Rhipicephalus sanguineus]|uniref:Nlr family card domain protein n=1 Tax=Rhipicephalus sanguineus TaxID=34632 RepID=A0A9D4Q2S1_RHISA|nr:hypothetical protein HPB52_014224 [Rhipicephalus sanguineus]
MVDARARLGVQLEEHDHEDTGDLRLVSIPGRRFLDARESELSLSEVGFIVCFLDSLLRSHKCVVAVDLDYIAASLLHKALTNMPTLSSVSVRRLSAIHTADVRRVCDAVASLKHISELRISNKLHSVYLELRSIDNLLRLTANLTSLDIGHLETSKAYSMTLTQALIDNTTITHLVVSFCIFTCGPTSSAEAFSKYLVKENATLRCLTLKASRPVGTNALTNLVDAISAADSLQDLVAEMQLACSEDMAILAKTFANRNLRRVEFARVKCCGRIVEARTANLSWEQRGGTMQPWLSAIAENSSVVKLSMNLSAFGAEECFELFRTVARNASLRRVSVCDFPEGPGIREACLVIQDAGLAQRVVIEDHKLTPENIGAFYGCTLVTSVTINYKEIGRRDFTRVFVVLVNCPQVTSLSVIDHADEEDDHVMLAMYIYLTLTSTLRNLRLSLQGRFYESLATNPQERNSLLLMALANHCSLKSVTLRMPLSDADCQALSELVLFKPMIRELLVPVSWDAFNPAFFDYFNPLMASNYNLIRVQLPSVPGCEAMTLAVQDLAKRNYSNLSRATRFVMGRRDPRGARALELMLYCPVFVEMIQEEANVDASRVVDMISRARKTYDSLDEFMKMAGVVKHGVECFPRSDGKAQLVDLNEYCWLEVRKYLNLLHVVNM